MIHEIPKAEHEGKEEISLNKGRKSQKKRQESNSGSYRYSWVVQGRFFMDKGWKRPCNNCGKQGNFERSEGKLCNFP